MNKLVEVYVNNFENIKKYIVRKYKPIDVEDLMQEMFFILNDKQIDGRIKDDIYYLKYIYSTAYYTLIYKYSQYNKNKLDLASLNDLVNEDNENVELIDLIPTEDNIDERYIKLEELENDKQLQRYHWKIKRYINRLENKNLTLWYKIQLFKKYYFSKMTYRDIGSETGIHYTYVHKNIKEIKEILSKKYKDIKNIDAVLTLLRYGRNN